MKVKATKNNKKLILEKQHFMRLEDLEILNKILKYEDYLTIKIISDGNYAYKVISYYYQNN